MTFEVWEKKGGIVARKLADGGDNNGGSEFEEGSEDLEQNASRKLKAIAKNMLMTTFVRVLYNGKDVTHLIPSCVMKAEPDEISWIEKNRRKLPADNAASRLLLCPIDRLFLHFDSGTKFQYDYLPEDCQAVFKKNFNHYNSEFVEDV